MVSIIPSDPSKTLLRFFWCIQGINNIIAVTTFFFKKQSPGDVLKNFAKFTGKHL